MNAIGGGGDMAGLRCEERSLRVKNLRANAFPRYRSLDTTEMTKWNMVVKGEMRV